MDFLSHIAHLIDVLSLFPVVGFLSGGENGPSNEQKKVARLRRELLGSHANPDEMKSTREIDRAVADYMARDYDAIAGAAYHILDDIPPDRSGSINYMHDVRASFERGLKLHLILQTQKTKYESGHDKNGNPIIKHLAGVRSRDFSLFAEHYATEYIAVLSNTLRRGVSKKTAIKYAGNAYRYDHEFLSTAMKMKDYIDDNDGDPGKRMPESVEQLATLLAEDSDIQREIASAVAQYRKDGEPEATDYRAPPSYDDPTPDDYGNDEEPEDDEVPAPQPEEPELPTPPESVEPSTTPPQPESTPEKKEKKGKRTTATRRKPQDNRKKQAKIEIKPETPAAPTKPEAPVTVPDTHVEILPPEKKKELPPPKKKPQTIDVVAVQKPEKGGLPAVRQVTAREKKRAVLDLRSALFATLTKGSEKSPSARLAAFLKQRAYLVRQGIITNETANRSLSTREWRTLVKEAYLFHDPNDELITGPMEKLRLYENVRARLAENDILSEASANAAIKKLALASTFHLATHARKIIEGRRLKIIAKQKRALARNLFYSYPFATRIQESGVLTETEVAEQLRKATESMFGLRY